MNLNSKDTFLAFLKGDKGETTVNVGGVAQTEVNFDSDPQEQINGKTSKVAGATANNFVSLDANGNLKDSGIGSNKVALSSKIGIYGYLYLNQPQTINVAEWAYENIAYDGVDTNNPSIFTLQGNGIKYNGTKTVFAKITHTLFADLNASLLYGFAVYRNGTQLYDCKRNSTAQVWTDTISKGVIVRLFPNDVLTVKFISGGKNTTLWGGANTLDVEILGEV